MNTEVANGRPKEGTVVDEAEVGGSADARRLHCSRAEGPSDAIVAEAATITEYAMQPELRHLHGRDVRASASPSGPLVYDQVSLDCHSRVRHVEGGSEFDVNDHPPTRAARARCATERLPPPGGGDGAGPLARGLSSGDMELKWIGIDIGMAERQRVAAATGDSAAELGPYSVPNATVKGMWSGQPAKRRALGEDSDARASGGYLSREGGALAETATEKNDAAAAVRPEHEADGGDVHGTSSGARAKRRRLRGKQAVPAGASSTPLLGTVASSPTEEARGEVSAAGQHNSMHGADSAGPSRPTSHVELHRLALRGGRHGQVLRARPPESASGPWSERGAT